jgi:hypothetical protein
MRTRTRALAVSAVLAATAQLATAQRPAAPVQPPAVLPSLPVQAPAAATPTQAPAANPPASPTPVAPPEGPMPTPMTPAQQPSAAMPGPIGPPAPVNSCPTCNTPTSGEPTDSKFCDDHKGPKEATWIRLDYTMNWLRPAPLPFPVVVGSTTGAGPTLLGESNLTQQMQSGIRVDGMTWTNDRHTFGLGLGGFMLEQRSRYDAISADSLSRPFFDVLALTPNALVVAAPGVATGTVATAATARFSGAEANLWWNLAECDWYSVNLFAGFRYLDLDESLTIYQSSTSVAGFTTPGVTVPAGGNVLLMDRFRTRNQFYGGQIGATFEARHGCFFADFTPRIGFGPNHESVNIDGSTTGGGGQPVPGGLLAVGSTGGPDGRTGNNGKDVTNYFALMTELGSRIGIQVTKGMRISVGYNFLYLNNVARPGNQVDTTVNPRLVPVSAAFGTLSGPRAPNPTFDREAFWAHGVSFSVELMY